MSWTRGGVACQIPREKTAQLCPTGGPSGSATLVLGAGRRKGTLIPVLGWWKAVAGEENEAEGTPPAASGHRGGLLPAPGLGSWSLSRVPEQSEVSSQPPALAWKIPQDIPLPSDPGAPSQSRTGQSPNPPVARRRSPECRVGAGELWMSWGL